MVCCSRTPYPAARKICSAFCPFEAAIESRRSNTQYIFAPCIVSGPKLALLALSSHVGWRHKMMEACTFMQLVILHAHIHVLLQISMHALACVCFMRVWGCAGMHRDLRVPWCHTCWMRLLLRLWSAHWSRSCWMDTFLTDWPAHPLHSDGHGLMPALL